MPGIYIHIPFCKQKCTYCDFASYPKEIGKAEAYFACLLREIDSRAEELKSITFDTVYVGGGTPSFVQADFIGATINHLKKRFKITPDAEITIEINPGTLTEEKVALYKKVGINRFSVGLQSANDKILSNLNRIHTADDFLFACSLLKGCNLSADVMIGLPDQTIDDVKQTIDLALKGGAKHVSVYALTPEEGTPMFSKYLNGELPDADEVADAYAFALDYLEKKSCFRYEVSNFAYKGFESKHNLNYWKRGDYIGLGVAASSCINNRRFTNTEKLDEYIHCLLHDRYAEIYSEQIEGDEIKKEYAMLALRTTNGVSLKDYTDTFGSSFLTDFCEAIDQTQRYLDISATAVRIKPNYLFVQNQIIIYFIG